MHGKLKRKEFMRLSALAAAGLFIDGCRTNKQKEIEHGPETDTIPVVKQKALPDPEIVITREDARYESLRQGFNKSVQHYPDRIIMCRNTDDVSTAVRYAAENGLKVSIKSGGHSFEGFSAIDGSLQINLSNMRAIKILNDTQISVEPGCTLGELNEVLLPQGRLLPAGSCGKVGIAGLTLGGGYGLFSRSYGLTCDHLDAITLVDGSGKIHKAENNDELLWACRGGGNGNFGVVTEMIFTTRKAPETLQSYRFKAYKLDSERAVKILKQWFFSMPELPLSCFSAFVLNGKTLTILITDHEGEDTALQKIIKELQGLTDKYIPGKREELQEAVKTFYGVQEPIYFKNASAGFYMDFSTVENCIDKVLEMVIENGMIYQVNTLGGNILNTENALRSSYAYRDFPYLSELQSYWDRPEQQAKYVKTFNAIQELISANNITAQYANYPSLTFKEYESAYYGKNISALKRIKKLFDPDDLFHYAQSISV